MHEVYRFLLKREPIAIEMINLDRGDKHFDLGVKGFILMNEAQESYQSVLKAMNVAKSMKDYYA